MSGAPKGIRIALCIDNIVLVVAIRLRLGCMLVEVVLEWMLFLEKEEVFVVVELQQQREILDLLMMVMDCPHSVPAFFPKLDLITFHFHLIQIGFLDLSLSPLFQTLPLFRSLKKNRMVLVHCSGTARCPVSCPVSYRKDLNHVSSASNG